MKTTIELPDTLIEEARRVAKEEGTTLRRWLKKVCSAASRSGSGRRGAGSTFRATAALVLLTSSRVHLGAGFAM